MEGVALSHVLFLLKSADSYFNPIALGLLLFRAKNVVNNVKMAGGAKNDYHKGK